MGAAGAGFKPTKFGADADMTALGHNQRHGHNQRTRYKQVCGFKSDPTHEQEALATQRRPGEQTCNTRGACLRCCTAGLSASTVVHTVEPPQYALSVWCDLNATNKLTYNVTGCAARAGSRLVPVAGQFQCASTCARQTLPLFGKNQQNAAPVNCTNFRTILLDLTQQSMPRWCNIDGLACTVPLATSCAQGNTNTPSDLLATTCGTCIQSF